MRGKEAQEFAADIAGSTKDRGPNHKRGPIDVFAWLCKIVHIHAMADIRERRHRVIAELIRNEPLANQEELAERLAGQGFAVTQATISRDLEQLGAVKARRDGRLGYILPDQLANGSRPSTRLAAVLRDWVRSIDFAGNLVVLKTPPGSAHLVGVALDQAALPDVVGTICGDDTLFVAVRDAALAPQFANSLRNLGT
jgi:transcriptional regulator of arginine metabolism